MLPKKIFYYLLLFLFTVIFTGIFLFVNYYSANSFVSSFNYWLLINEMIFKFYLNFFEYIYYNFPKIYMYSSLFVILIPIFCVKNLLKKSHSLLDCMLILILNFFIFIGLIFPFELFNYPDILNILEYYYIYLCFFSLFVTIFLFFRLSESLIFYLKKLFIFLSDTIRL